MRIVQICLLLLVTVSTSLAAEPIELPDRDQVHLFLLVGQSNMAGRGVVAEEDLKPHPRVVMFSKEETWVPAIDPMHFDKPVAGVGLGKAFGLEIAKSNPIFS